MSDVSTTVGVSYYNGVKEEPTPGREGRMSELLPCPFCGSRDIELVSGAPETWVRCRGCRASTDTRSVEQAVYAWNRRARVAEDDYR